MKKKITLDCISPPSRCLKNPEISESETELLKVAGSLPGFKENLKDITINIEVPYNIDLKTNMFRLVEKKELKKSFGPIKIYVNKIPRGASLLARLIYNLSKNMDASKLLVITPSEPLAKIISEHLKVPLLTESIASSWFFSKQKIAIIDYNNIARNPWILGASEETVLLLPERIIAHKSRQNPGRGLLWETLWFAQSLGATSISRALTLMYNKGFIQEAKLISEPTELVPDAKEGLSKPNADYLTTYSERTFKELWGASLKLRGYQVESLYSLYSILSPKGSGTAIIILPTGAGKSAIFQVAARVLADIGWGSTPLIISPLRALIHDQVKNAIKKGLKTAYIDATVPKDKRTEALDLALAGLLDLLYITPERFESPEFEKILRESDCALIVLDEAHTISRWGMSFRPSYLYMAKVIGEIKKTRRDLPIMALTATAPPDIVDDVIEVLGNKENVREIKLDLSSPPSYPEIRPGEVLILRASPIRDEIKFDIRPGAFGEERIKDLAFLLKELIRWSEALDEPWIGLVYTGYVKSKRVTWANAEEIARRLSDMIGEKVIYYHGKLTSRQRKEIEDAVEKVSLGNQGPRLIVATKAFGMGIDIPNIRFVVHFMPSDSIEDFYQEVGRAARDGKEAKAIAYYNSEDFRIKESLKVREVVRPSDVLILYNFIVKTAKYSKSRKKALIPLQALYKLLGSKERASKALEILRLSSILDYTVIEGSLSISNDECLIRFDKEVCVSVSQDMQRILGRIRLCSSKGSPIPQVGIEIAGKKFGESCENGLDIVLGKDKYYYIELSPWRRHSPRLALSPDVYVRTLFMSSIDIRKLRELKNLLEEALKAKARGGMAVNSLMKNMIRKALEESSESLRSLEEILNRLGIKECESLEECLNEIGNIVIELDRRIGESSYILAAAGSEMASILKRYAEEKLGRTIRDPAVEYRRLLTSARKGPHNLSNRGFVILLVSNESRSLKIILEKLSDYPYKFVFIFKRSNLA